MKVLFLCLTAVVCVTAEEDNGFGGMFWPPYQSHLLQSTKAQIDELFNITRIRPKIAKKVATPEICTTSFICCDATNRGQAFCVGNVSKPAPSWEGTAIVNGEVKTIKSEDYLGKYLIFFFYPLDFTFVCPTEIIAFSDRVAEFRKIGAEVVACSVDSHFTHLAWANTDRKEGGLGKINIPLLSDLTHKISRDYGVLLEDLGHTLRGLFIIDPKGILRQITMNDLPVGRSVDETLRLVQAFQHTDQHGEVCPAGWQPGADTIIPDPEGKMKYFQKNREL